MKTGDMMELDQEITGLEKQLANMYKERMSLLESEMQSLRAKAESLSGASPRSTARSAAPGVAAPVVARTGRKERKQISKPGKKRSRMSTEEVERRLIETVKAAGSEGISLKGISEAAGVNYQTAAKKLKEMPDRFIKTGELKEGRFFLKS